MDWEAVRRLSGIPGRGNLENTLPFVGRVLGQVRLYGERGRGGGGADIDENQDD